MFAELAFFSLVELVDPAARGAYNRWHQLDHRPENLALPGVAWGDRWARPREGRAPGADPRWAQVDFAAMYWFRPPIEESVREWDALGEASFQWGRGPLLPGVERRLLAFFRPVKGYAAPRALVPPEVLPFRPNRGVHLTLTRFADPHGVEAHARHAAEDREVIPRLLELDGVAGAWTFSFSHPQRHSSLPFDGGDTDGPGALRIRLLYLETDPGELGGAIQALSPPSDPAASVLLSAPFRTIVPWQDW